MYSLLSSGIVEGELMVTVESHVQRLTSDLQKDVGISLHSLSAPAAVRADTGSS